MSTSADIKKVHAAGFRVFRLHESHLMITECKRPGSWITVIREKTRAALLRSWDEIMADPKKIAM